MAKSPKEGKVVAKIRPDLDDRPRQVGCRFPCVMRPRTCVNKGRSIPNGHWHRNRFYCGCKCIIRYELLSKANRGKDEHVCLEGIKACKIFGKCVKDWKESAFCLDYACTRTMRACGLQVFDEENGKPAETRWQRICREADRTRVDFTPVTGRTHQVRIADRLCYVPVCLALAVVMPAYI